MARLVRSQQDIVLFGKQKELKLAILQAVATSRIIWNKDVGQIVGMPIEDLPRAKHQDRKLTIQFINYPKPPWRRLRDDPKRATYTIPDVKTGLTWAEIKEVAQPFTWGKFRATALMSNNRQMAVYAESASEAEKVLRSLATLSKAHITKLTTSEEVLVDPRQQKLATRMYPAYATLVTEPTDVQGLPIEGRKAFGRKRRRLSLYTEPKDLSPLG